MLTEKIGSWFQKLNKNVAASFYATIVAGLLTHLFIMTNKVFNYNEFSVLFLDNEEMTLGRMAEGRWFVAFIGQLVGGNYSMQLVTGILGILMIALCAAMITSILDIKSRIFAALTGIMMVVFPALTSFMAFTQLGDAWFFAVLLSVWAVYLCERKSWGQWPALVMIGLSLAIHQAYVTVAIAFMFVIIFIEIYEKEKSLKQLLPRIGKYLITLIGGFAVYYIGVKITAVIYEYQLSDYHGISEMTSFSVKGIAKGIVYSYRYFFEYFFTTKYLFSVVFIIVDIVLAVIFLYISIRAIVLALKEKKAANAIWKLLLLLVLPIGMNGLPVLLADRVGAGVDQYMMYSLVFLWILLLVLCDRVESIWSLPGKKLILWCSFLGLTLHIANDYVITNQAYYREQAVTTQTTAFLNRLAMRIETTEGWNEETPILIACDGDLFGKYVVSLPAFDDLLELRGTAYEPNYSSEGIVRFMEYYLHFPVNSVGEEIRKQIIESEQYREMPIYPDQESIQMMNEVLVIKLSKE